MITPIWPKMIARPSATRISTLPSERPWKRFWTRAIFHWYHSIASRAFANASRSRGSRDSGVLRRLSRIGTAGALHISPSRAAAAIRFFGESVKFSDPNSINAMLSIALSRTTSGTSASASSPRGSRNSDFLLLPNWRIAARRISSCGDQISSRRIVSLTVRRSRPLGLMDLSSPAATTRGDPSGPGRGVAESGSESGAILRPSIS